MTTLRFLLLSILCVSLATVLRAQTDPSQPNILIIVADDMGTDVTNGYESSPLMPTTPTIDGMQANGLTFQNAWAAPKCTPSRAAVLSGKFGVKTGVTGTPGNLDFIHTSLFDAVAAETSGAYANAVIGKWHISSPHSVAHVTGHGVDYYEGFLEADIPDYYDWEKIDHNGTTTRVTEYATTHLTTRALSWINSQSQPWLMVMSHAAPHSPFHVPPSGLYTTPRTNTNRQKFVAAIEALDAETERLLMGMPTAVLNNTMIFFLGDNGSPNGVLQTYPTGHGKASLYQGGVRVPLIVSGQGVSRRGSQEQGMVHIADIYATVLETIGGSLEGGIYNSHSFAHLLSRTTGSRRSYNYSELDASSGDGWTITEGQYKLINFNDGTQEFYDLDDSPYETNNIIGSLTTEQEAIKADLEDEAEAIQNGWSCRDGIRNGDEGSIDDCSNEAPCPNDNTTSTTNIGCCFIPSEPNLYQEWITTDIRNVYSNDYPNHEFCNDNNHPSEPRYYLFEVDKTPSLVPGITEVVSNNGRPARYYGVAMNGVLMAPAPATPFIFENPNTGEYNWDWVFEPTTNQGSGRDRVGLDCSSAHIGPQGYHYHGNMFEYVETIHPGLTTTNIPPAEPVQIGWASDGFPILYRFGPNGAGGLSELDPSYRVKAGDRPGDGITAPCGPYNGKYTNDFEYVAGLGDLDECNGVMRSVILPTSDGVETFPYFYVITTDFPQIGRCLQGLTSSTFENDNRGSTSPLLPLDLLDFHVDVKADAQLALLHWLTSNEVGVSHFEIERSSDASSFYRIGELKARNQSGENHQYEYSDQLASAGTWYYRLKMVDLDGRYSYSPIRKVVLANKQLTVSVQPNPSSKYVRWTLNEPATQGGTVSLYNGEGQLLSVQTFANIPHQGGIMSLEMQPAGVYFLSVEINGQARLMKKVVKQ